MPPHKPDLHQLSLSQLAEVTGQHRSTIRKRLSGLEPVRRDGRTVWYDPHQALPLLFLVAGHDLTSQRARLARAQADGQELRNRVASGELLERDRVQRVAAAIEGAATAKLRTIASRSAPSLRACASIQQLEQTLLQHVDQVLTELAEELAALGQNDSKPQSSAELASEDDTSE